MLKQLGPSEPYAYLPAPNPTDLKRRLLVLSERGKVSLQFSKGHQFSNGAPARECICWVIWRRGRDSNPRYGYPYAAFRVRCFQPLSHLSAGPRAGVSAPAREAEYVMECRGG